MRPSLEGSKRAGLVALILVAVVASARGDLLWLRDGQPVEVRGRSEPSGFVVTLPGREIHIPHREITRREPSSDLASHWKSRRTAAIHGTPEDRLAAIWWAIQHGLNADALALLDHAIAGDPPNPTLNRIQQTAKLLKPALNDPDLDSLQNLLPANARFARGPHTLLVHQHDDDEAARKVALLERVFWTFYLEQAARGITLHPPRHRLVLLWFGERDAYQARLRAEGATAFLDTRGYFHPTRLIVLQCDERAFDRASRYAGTPGRQLRRELTRTHRDIGTAAHEWVHLLSRESGLVERHDDWPLWLHEGFAMQFEAASAGDWNGPGQPSAERLADLLKSPRPLPPATLLDPSQAKLGYNQIYYASAWAWVYYLRSEQDTLWTSLLHLGRSPGAVELRRPDALIPRIERESGKPLADLARDEMRFLLSLPKPR